MAVTEELDDVLRNLNYAVTLHHQYSMQVEQARDLLKTRLAALPWPEGYGYKAQDGIGWIDLGSCEIHITPIVMYASVPAPFGLNLDNEDNEIWTASELFNILSRWAEQNGYAEFANALAEWV